MDREEDGWEVLKCYLSDDLASDSEDEKQLNKVRREAAFNKKKREASKLKNRKKQFRNAPYSEETLKPSVNQTKDKVKNEKSVTNMKNLLFLRKRRTFPV